MIHLHVHTTFSFLDGYGTADQLISRLGHTRQTACAITDHGNIYGHRTFGPAMEKAGIKPIYGCEMYVKGVPKYYHVTLLAKNLTGYSNLCRLVSLSNQADHFDRRPQITWQELQQNQDGLIILSGCFGDGILHRTWQTNKEEVIAKARWLNATFDDFYIEVQHVNLEEADYMYMVGAMLGIPVVPTFDAHYPEADDYDVEDTMLAIGIKAMKKDQTRMKLFPNLWLMSDQEAAKCFSPEKLAVTHEIADKCNVVLEKVQPIRIDNAKNIMLGMIEEQSKRLPKEMMTDAYRERLAYELSVIDTLGLHSYFVIMSDTVSFFKRLGRFIGPARGSSAGSLVSYLLAITEIDPIVHGLSFERFLDINRKDYPDIDTDFPHSMRDEVIRYLGERYGDQRVARLAVYTTYKGGSVFWDIGRTYGIDREILGRAVRDIPPLVNDEFDMSDIVQMPSVAAAIRDFPELGVATRMEGQVRQLGQHASGYVVSPEDLSQLVGYGRVSDGSRVASLDKYQAEAMGLIKLDILGLETLDVIEDVAREVGLTNTDLYRMPHDRVILEKFNEQKVAGIFQMEGQAVRRILPMFKIESIEDIAFVSAVARPGASLTLDPANVVPEEVRHFIYKKRYFVYQEELMAILRFLGFSWEDVTKFRKLVSRKQITELNRLYATKFAEGCESRGIKEHALFWETINRTGAYMFNKSHAVAYAYLSYIMMHLKVNYPGVFLKCYLNHAKKDVNRRDVIREFVREGWGVTIFDPKRSKEGFQTDESRREILGGLLSIKGIGAAKARAVMAGKIDKGCQKAISGAGTAPEHYAPWACLEDLGNRYKIGSLPEGEYIVVARVWDVDEGRCMIEDINGAEKAYFNPRYVDIEEGRLYRLSVSKFKYCKIESARPKD